MRSVGRTSPLDVFGRVAVFGDHPPAEVDAPGARAAAAAAELPAAEVSWPDDDWADMVNTLITASRQDVHRRCDGEEVPCLVGLSQMPERSRHAHIRVSRTHALRYGVADPRRATGTRD